MIRTPSRAVSRLAWAGLVSLAGLTLSAAPASAATPAEQTLPNTTLALVKVNSTAELREAFRRSQFGQMLADPAMTPLKEDFKAKLEERNARFQQRFGMTLSELLELPQGPAWLAVVGRDNVKPPVAVLLGVDAGKNRPQMQALLDRATKQAEGSGAKVSVEEFPGGTIHLIQPPQEPEKPTSPLAWTSQEGLFTFATDVDALKDVLAHAQGRADSLAASEGFGPVQERVGRDAQVVWYVDLAQLFRRLAQGADAQGGNAQQFEAMLELLGINSLKAVGGGFAFTSEDFDSVSRTYLYAPGQGQGLVGVFQMPRVNLRPEPWVPAAVASYWSISWDLDKAYVAIKDLANMLAPNFLEQFEKDLAGPGAAPLSFQKDLFGPLGDRVTVLSDFKKPVTEQSQRFLVAVDLEDAAAFQNTLNKLIKLGGAAPKKREFQGTTIYDFELPAVPEAGAAGGLRGPVSVAIAQDHVYAATDPSLLEQVLRGGGPALADGADFQAVAKLIPDRVSSLSYTRPEEQARLLYDMVKNGQLQKALEGANMVGGPEVPRVDVLIDPEKLPEFSVFAKYLAPGGGFSLMDETGVTLTRFTLRKTTNP